MPRLLSSSRAQGTATSAAAPVVSSKPRAVAVPVAGTSSAPRCVSSRRVVANASSVQTPSAPAAAASPAAAAPHSKWPHNEWDFAARHGQIMHHFPSALGVDDWISRVETVLSSYGFTGDNSIAMTNLCRDEVTSVLKDKIEAVFGSSFNTNGLGGVLTCGVTGMGAGLSHSPICDNGRERYVFFSFPHIAIDSKGTVGSISRPGREGSSCACGALAKCLGEFKLNGYASNCKVPGVHDPLDPEYSILKQRLARRLRHENTDMDSLTLTSITAAAERTITNDLEFLIEQAVDTKKADYAVVTGVQVHNWASSLGDGAPSLEFVAPTKFMVVINGVKTHLDLSRMPSMSPRQLMLMAAASNGDAHKPRNVALGRITADTRITGSTLQMIPQDYLVQRLGGVAPAAVATGTSSWQADLSQTQPGSPRSPTIESLSQDYSVSFFARENFSSRLIKEGEVTCFEGNEHTAAAAAAAAAANGDVATVTANENIAAAAAEAATAPPPAKPSGLAAWWYTLTAQGGN